MAGEERLRWILELGVDDTSLLREVANIEARFNQLSSRLQTRVAGRGNDVLSGPIGGNNLASEFGGEAARAEVVLKKLSRLRDQGIITEGKYQDALRRVDPAKILGAATLPKTLGNVTGKDVNETAQAAFRQAMIAATAIQREMSASGKGLITSTNALAAERNIAAVSEAEVAAINAEMLARNGDYIKDIVRFRAAQARASAQIEQGLAVRPAYASDVAAIRLAQEQQLAQVKENLAKNGKGVPIIGSGGDVTTEGLYAQALARRTAASKDIEAQEQRILAENPLYAASLASVRASRVKIESQELEILSADGLYAQATAGLAATKKAMEAQEQEILAENPLYIASLASLKTSRQRQEAQVQEALSNDALYVQATAAISVSRKAMEVQEQQILAANPLYVASLVSLQSIRSQQEAAILQQLAGDSTYVASTVGITTARKSLEAQEQTILAESPAYIASMVAIKVARAQQQEQIRATLAADAEYIAATDGIAKARRLEQANVAAARHGVLLIPGQTVEETEAAVGARTKSEDTFAKARLLNAQGIRTEFPVGADEVQRAGIVAASEKELSAKVRLAEATEELARLEASKVGASATELDIQQQIAVTEARLNSELAKRAAAAKLQAFEQRVAAGTETSTGFQRLQAGIAGRSGNFRDPAEFQKFGQLLSSRFLSTAGFAVSGIATYAVFAGLQKMISDSGKLEQTLSQIRAQFQALGDDSNFAGFRNGILQISKDSGEAANDVAKIAFQFKGAFEGQKSDSGILREVNSAVQISRVTGLSLTEVTDSLTATALDYGTSIEHIGDATLALQDRTGVLATHIITAIADLAPVADEVGLKMEKIGAIAAVAQQRSGISGSAIAESLNRVLPSIQNNAGQILELFQQIGTPQQTTKIEDALASGQTGVVFDELGKSYNKLSGAQQKYVVELLGGRRETKTIIPIFKNYQDVLNDTTAALDSNGRLAKSYGELQDTVRQQLAKVAAALKTIGAELLDLGLSDLIQTIAKAIGLLVTAATDLIAIFTKLNDVTGGWVGKLVAVTIAVKALSALAPILSSVGILGAVRQGAGVLPGVAGGAPHPGYTAAGQDLRFVGGGAETGFLAGTLLGGKKIGGALGSLGSKITSATEGSSKVIAGAGARMGSALTGLGTALEALAPLIGILLLAAAVTSVVDGFSKTKEKLKALAGDIVFEGGFSTSEGSKSIDKYAEEREKALHPDKGFHGVTLNPFTNLKTLGGQLASLGSKSASDLAADAVQKSSTKGFASVLEDAFSEKDLKEQIDKYNKAADKNNEDPRNTRKKHLSEDDIKKIAKDGTTDNKQFQAVIDLFTQSAAEKKGLGQAYRKIIEGDRAHSQDISDLKSGLETLPVLEIQYGQGQITNTDFIEKTGSLVNTTKRLLFDAIKKKADPKYIASLKQSLDQEEQLRNQAIEAQIKSLTDNATQAGLLSGANENQQKTLNIQAGVEALHTPDALKDPNSVETARAVVKAQQDQVAYMAAHAKNAAEAQKILDAGFRIDPKVLQFLQKAAVKAAPKDVANALVESAAIMGRQQQDVIDQLVEAKGGFEKGVEAYIDELYNKIGELQKLGGHSDEINTLYGNIAQLKIFADSGKVPGAQGKAVDVEGPDLKTRTDAYNSLAAAAVSQDPLGAAIEARQEAATKYNDAINIINDPKASGEAKKQAKVDATNAAADKIKADQQYNDAQFGIAQSKQAIAASLANGDPVAQAQAAINQASLDMQQASARGDEAGVNNAIASYNQAQFQMQQALEGIAQAYVGVLAAAADGDAVKAATAGIAAAEIQAKNAHGEAEKLNALAAEISAQHALRDALNAVADAQKNIVLAVLQAAGKTVEAARQQQKIDKEAYGRYLKQHPGATKENDATAAGLYQKTISDAATVRDTQLQTALDDINFGLSTHKIFNSQAIARLKVLNANSKLTKAEHQQLEQQIYSLQHQSQQDLQFNLPTDIKLPTLYEARRLNNTPGGGNHYQDSRRIEINISTNAKLDGKDVQHLTDSVTSAVSAPPRYGTRPRTY